MTHHEPTPVSFEPAALASLPGSPRALSPWGRWWLAARPKTLPAAATPVLVGSACALAASRGAVASTPVAVAPAVAALAGALLLQIAANFANDVFDFEKGADTAQRLGPTRAVQAGWISPGAMRAALWVVLGLALGIGVYLSVVSGPVIFAIGLASIAAALAYTGGPYPLGYHGLGDVCVFLFFGVVAVAGSCFVALGRVTPLAWSCSVPIGALTTAILVVNNVRDAETDRVARKRTLAVRFGVGFGIAEYHALLALAYLVPVGIWLLEPARLWTLLPLLSLPLAVDLSRRIRRDRGARLNTVLAHTARLLLCFGVLLALAIALGSPPCPASRP